MKPQPLSIDLLVLDGGTQNRLAINEDTVEDYAELIRQSDGEWPFPPCDVFHDGNQYLVAEGFHRTLGAERAKRSSVPCVVHKGTATDARIFGMTANDRHGLRLTRADKRACVEWLLDNGGKMPQKEVAEKAGVSRRLVQTIIAERNPASVAGKVTPPKRDGEAQSAPDTPIRGEPDPFLDDGMEPEEEEPTSRPPRNGTEAPAADYGKCPNCAGTSWDEDEDGVSCSKCHHPHGEPAGDVDKDRLTVQRSKTVKTAEALMRAFDDLQTMKAKECHGDTIETCKGLVKTAKGWK